LKGILKEQNRSVWIGFNWFRIKQRYQTFVLGGTTTYETVSRPGKVDSGKHFVIHRRDGSTTV